MNQIPITAKGAKKLKKQLEQLKQVERPKIIKAIAEARAHGDLSENAEYHAAREQQSLTEGRIATIESILAEAQVIDVGAIDSEGKVVFGATVDLMDIDNEQKSTYQIVGAGEADSEAGLISITSPIARALIGKQEGDVVHVKAPGGIVEYEIVRVRYI